MARSTGWVLAAALAALAGAAAAEDGDWTFSVGGGPAFEPEYEGADDYRVVPLPVLEVRFRDIAFLSAEEGLGWNALKTRNFRAGPVATYYWGSGDRPTGVADIDPGFQIGAFAEFAFDYWKFDARALYAVSGSSEGLRVNLGAAYGVRLEKDWTVVVRADTTLYNDNEMKTYFGISPREASDSRLAEHDPSAGFKDVGLGLKVTYDFSEHWSLLGLAKAHYLVGDAADSPLVKTVGSEAQFYGGLAVAYRF